MTVTVIVPVLSRPHRVEPLLESLRASERDVPLQPLFVASPGDTEQLEALRASGAEYIVVEWEAGPADFAMKTNLACAQTDTEWILAGADDLEFTPGWADEAIRVSEQTGKRFVATNDRGNGMVIRGKHATHPLVHRSYLPLAVVNRPGHLYHEGYDHQCCDCESSETAMWRGEFVAAPNSVVIHRHFMWRGGQPRDKTYEKGQARGREDRDLLNQRRPLWGGAPDRC